MRLLSGKEEEVRVAGEHDAAGADGVARAVGFGLGGDGGHGGAVGGVGGEGVEGGGEDERGRRERGGAWGVGCVLGEGGRRGGRGSGAGGEGVRVQRVVGLEAAEGVVEAGVPRGALGGGEVPVKVDFAAAGGREMSVAAGG